MRIQNNVMSANTHRVLNGNNIALGKSIEKLSSGFRINRSADDAAGLSISEKMRAQIKGLNRASMNAQDGISMIQAAESALSEFTNIIQRVRELGVQAANVAINSDTAGGGDGQDGEYLAINKELAALENEMVRIIEATQFNGKNLFDAENDESVAAITSGGANVGNFDMYFHVGSNSDGQASSASTLGVDANVIDLPDFDLIAQITAAGAAYTLAPGTVVDSTSTQFMVDGSDSSKAQALIGEMDLFLKGVSNLRSDLGAMQNRLESTVRNLDTISENTQAAESRIRDIDMAKEMSNFTRQNILSQAATAMLAQANQVPQTVLQLLR